MKKTGVPARAAPAAGTGPPRAQRQAAAQARTRCWAAARTAAAMRLLPIYYNSAACYDAPYDARSGTLTA